MKRILVLICLLIALKSFAQKDSVFFKANKPPYEIMFWGGTMSYVHTQLIQGIDKMNYSLGGEIKYSNSFYGSWLSGSCYINYRRMLFNTKYDLPKNIISIGAHFTIFALELSVLAENQYRPLFQMTPKIGYDFGNLSIFYGYNINFNSDNKRAFLNHSIQLKYGIAWPVL